MFVFPLCDIHDTQWHICKRKAKILNLYILPEQALDSTDTSIRPLSENGIMHRDSTFTQYRKTRYYSTLLRSTHSVTCYDCVMFDSNLTKLMFYKNYSQYVIKALVNVFFNVKYNTAHISPLTICSQSYCFLNQNDPIFTPIFRLYTKIYTLDASDILLKQCQTLFLTIETLKTNNSNITVE